MSLNENPLPDDGNLNNAAEDNDQSYSLLTNRSTGVSDSGSALAVTAPSDVSTTTASVPANAYLSIEWQINGTWGSHADQVWANYTGAGIIVTDLDDGFQYTHPDLTANYSTALSYDTINNSADGAAATTNDDHGTSVMGEIIGTGANGTGSLGIAYGAEAFGIRMGFGNDGSLTQIQEGFQIALSHGASVMNNSWGFTDAFSDDFGAVSSVSYFSGIAAAMKSYADTGRGGLGGVMVFAAGNDRAEGDNTNYHNMQNSPYVVTVAAIDSNGIVASFSNPGTSILVSAAGVNDVTTDKTGNGGYVSGDYVYFSGTSAAAPVVTGVVALMMQANPNLGWRDVQEILAYSAQHNDPTSAGWQTNGATNWNGGGLYYSSDYGFGAVNALAAVRLAETWNTQQDSSNMLTENGGSNSNHLAITSALHQSTITVAQNMNVEHVEVNLNLTDTSLSGLTVTLIAPDGTSSVLINHPTEGTGTNTIQFQTTTVADWGEMSAGTWTLDVQDSTAGATGTLSGWSLTFLGSTIPANQTFIFTDTFAGFSGADLAARSIISDVGGGVDTLNLAAVSTNSIVDLTADTGTIAGHSITIATGTTIGTIYGGDGNDMFTGNNTGTTYLYGERGNDIFIAAGGTVHIDGGIGTDTVVYSETIGDFQFTFTDSTHQIIADTVGTLGTDLITNVEDFTFAGTSYTLQQLESYAAANGGNSPPPNIIVAPSDDDINLIIPNGRHTNYTYDSNSDGSMILTAAALGSKGATPWLDVERSGNSLTLNYLSSHATNVLTINGGNNDETLTLTGITPSKMSALLTMGAGNDTINIGLTATVTLHAGNGDNTVVAANSNNIFVLGAGTDNVTCGNGSSRITLGGGNDTISVGNGNNIIVTGGGNNTISCANGSNRISAGGGDNVFTVGNGNNVITAGNGDNIISVGHGKNTIVAGGGDNTINDGAGTNVITVGNGENQINIGHGRDSVGTGTGADDFILLAMNAATTLRNYSEVKGDTINLSAVLQNFDPQQDAINDFVRFTNSGKSTVISIDQNGAAGGSHFVGIIAVSNEHLNLQTMVANGHLVV